MANILITGGAGFIGQELVAPLLAANPDARLTLTDVIEPPVPTAVAPESQRITTLKADLTDVSVLQSLLSNKYSPKHRRERISTQFDDSRAVLEA